MFCSSHFSFIGFCSLLVTKLQKYYVIIANTLQGKMGKMEKKGKKITQLKWQKNTKNQKKKIWDERNISDNLKMKIKNVSVSSFMEFLMMMDPKKQDFLSKINRLEGN